MSAKRTGLPQLPEVQARRNFSFDLPAAALAKWNAGVQAKDAPEVDTLNIYEPIGQDFWGEGMTAKRVSGILRAIGDRPVIVNINSPGGDVFEGIAIYNILRAHTKPVDVRVVGLAASAASVIAMAGDKVQVARAGFLMIHNVWILAMGNRNDLREAADFLEPFDDALASVYVARTGLEKKVVAKMMDKETWFSGDQAIENGFADELLPADQVEERPEALAAAGLRAVEAQMARHGIPRAARLQMIATIKEHGGAPSASSTGTRDAAHDVAERDAGEVAAAAGRLTAFFKGQAGSNPPST